MSMFLLFLHVFVVFSPLPGLLPIPFFSGAGKKCVRAWLLFFTALRLHKMLAALDEAPAFLLQA
jgi:hypothetical protein